MRRALSLILLVAWRLAAQQVGLEGTVVDQSTGQPMRGVHVRLVTGMFDGGQGGVNEVYGAISDAKGHFSSDNMKPGLYLVMAERAGFVQVRSASASAMPFQPLALKSGQRLTDFKLEMTPRAVIAGRVVDEYGDPVDKVTVELESVSPGPSQVIGFSSFSTDDHGQFRLITAPGKYYVKANLRDWDQEQGAIEIRTDGSSSSPFVETYYPSAATKATAGVVEVAAGQDVTTVEIHLTRKAGVPSRGLTVSGIVSGLPEHAGGMVQFRSSETRDMLDRNVGIGPDGKFALSGMPPGEYMVMAMCMSNKASLRSRALKVQLVSDQTNLQLALTPGEELRGTLELVGATPAEQALKRTIRLEVEDFSFGESAAPSVEADKDGSFRIANVLPGKYKVVVEPMPENGYLKAVLVDNKPADEDVLDLSQGAGSSHLKLAIAANGGQVSGRVLGKDGAPVEGFVQVLLQSGPKIQGEENAVRATDGKYSFQRIRPGKYRLYALDILELASLFNGDNEEETMKLFFDAAEEIDIKEGDRLTKDITAFSKLPEKK